LDESSIRALCATADFFGLPAKQEIMAISPERKHRRATANQLIDQVEQKDFNPKSLRNPESFVPQ
jgi:hypothetical protein